MPKIKAFDENYTRYDYWFEKRPNPYEKTMQHLKTIDVYDLIRDCAVIISAHIGKKGITRLQERGMQLYFTKGNIQEALEEWLAPCQKKRCV